MQIFYIPERRCYKEEMDKTHTASFERVFTFSVYEYSEVKDLCAYLFKYLIFYYRRADRLPSPHSRICSCHFRDGKRENYPTIYDRNSNKLFNFVYSKRNRKKVQEVPCESSELEPSTSGGTAQNKSVAVLNAEITLLQIENETLKKEIEILKTVPWSLDFIKNNDRLVRFYTGLPSEEILYFFLSLFDNIDVDYFCGWKVTRLSQHNQIFLTLMKLRLNLKHTDLSVRFACSKQTVTNVTITWIHIIHKIIFQGLMSEIPSQIKNKACLPNCFSQFTNCRIVLDCTEVYCAIARKSMLKQRLTYSHYKHRNTFKALVGVAPNGVVTFSSVLYPGSTSDKAIVNHSGILSKLSPGDLVLADKGFLISELLPAGVALNIPPFLSTPQFTPNQVYKTRSIARARIHVERAIQRIKGYTILNYIPYKLRNMSTVVWQTVCALTNFQYPLIKKVDYNLQ